MAANGRQYLYEQYLEAGHGVSFRGQGKKWDTAEDVADVVEAIKACKNLKYLELEGNTLGVDAAKELGKSLESHPELEMALWKDLFTGRLKDEIPKALHFLFGGVDLAGARLHRLDLSDNAIGPVGMAGLAPFFNTPSSFSIKELIVNNQGLGPEGGSTFAAALMSCYELSQSSGDPFQLKVFVCGRNRQENKGAANWAKLFSTLRSLEEIHMPQNGINPPGFKPLSLALLNNLNLRVINFEDNTLRPDGARMIASSLPALQYLEELNLGDCLLKSSGVRSILEGIEGLSSLQVINFASNEILKRAGLHAASVLRTLPNLTTLNLSENEFGDTAVEEISRLLPNVNVIIDDDSGEGDEEEEENDENQNESNEENASSEEEGELLDLSPFDFSENRSLFEPISPFQTPDVSITAIVEEKDPVSAFLLNPTFSSYMKLQPRPGPTLVESFREKTDDTPFPELCIWAAITATQLPGLEVQECFDFLLLEAMRETNSNNFVTSLLICLGFIKPESKKTRLAAPTETTIIALTNFLAEQPVPVVVYQAIRLFFQSVAVQRFQSLQAVNQNMLEIIGKRLSVCNL